MSWPQNLYTVRCINFPPALLPAIKHALENKDVEWISTHDFTMMSTGFFVWMDCNWQIDENQEMVEAIYLRLGKLDNQDLTAMVLKYTI